MSTTAMNNIRNRRVVGASAGAMALALVLCAAPEASADTVRLRLDSSNGVTGTTELFGEDRGNTAARRFVMTDVDPGTFGQIYAFCVDLEVFLASPGDYKVTPGLFAPTVRTRLTQLADLAWDVGVGLSSISGLNANQAAAAFQLAAWEIVYDTGDDPYDLDAGNFKGFTNAAGNTARTRATEQAADWLANLGTADRTYNLVLFEAHPEGSSQNLMSVVPIPVPAAAWLLLSAFGGMALLRRRSAAA